MARSGQCKTAPRDAEVSRDVSRPAHFVILFESLHRFGDPRVRWRLRGPVQYLNHAGICPCSLAPHAPLIPPSPSGGPCGCRRHRCTPGPLAGGQAGRLGHPFRAARKRRDGGRTSGKITTELRYTFDRGESLRPRTIVRDVTGHGNNGRVFVSNGGRLHKVKGHPGRAALFPCRGRGRAVISAPDKRFLDPGQHPFWFGATIKVRDDQALPGRDPNIMQKGEINQPGGR